MSEKINSFEDWVKNEPFCCHTYYPSLAWNAACKMKDEEIEKLMVLQTELEAKNYDLQKENEELKKQIAKLKRNSFER